LDAANEANKARRGCIANLRLLAKRILKNDQTYSAMLVRDSVALFEAAVALAVQEKPDVLETCHFPPDTSAEGA